MMRPIDSLHLHLYLTPQRETVCPQRSMGLSPLALTTLKQYLGGRSLDQESWLGHRAPACPRGQEVVRRIDALQELRQYGGMALRFVRHNCSQKRKHSSNLVTK